jgi:hypothetical protein
MKNNKTKILEEIDALDLLAEKQSLTEQEKAKRKTICTELDFMWRPKEIQAKHRSRDRNIKGDKNATYFFMVANQRKRNKTISNLDGDGLILEDTNSMIDYALKFYKKLFWGRSER